MHAQNTCHHDCGEIEIGMNPIVIIPILNFEPCLYQGFINLVIITAEN